MFKIHFAQSKKTVLAEGAIDSYQDGDISIGLHKLTGPKVASPARKVVVLQVMH